MAATSDTAAPGETPSWVPRDTVIHDGESIDMFKKPLQQLILAYKKMVSEKSIKEKGMKHAGWISLYSALLKAMRPKERDSEISKEMYESTDSHMRIDIAGRLKMEAAEAFVLKVVRTLPEGVFVDQLDVTKIVEATWSEFDQAARGAEKTENTRVWTDALRYIQLIVVNVVKK